MNSMESGVVLACGDLNLTPAKLDDKLKDFGRLARRIPFDGEYHSFLRWDSVNKFLQRTSIDHLISNSNLLTREGWILL